MLWKNRKRKIFLSVIPVSADRDYAKWIAWILEAEGYSVIIDIWDFGPGQSFIRNMYKALENSKRIIAIFSPKYFEAKYTGPEWEAEFANDPSGEQQLLIPVRVKSFTAPKFFTSRIYIDLVDIDEESAKKLLLNAVRLERLKPLTKPPYPDAKKPNYPNSSSQPVTPKRESVASSQSHFDHRLGQIDRETQFKHFKNNIPKENSLKKGKPMGFIVCGAKEDWPESIGYRLDYLMTLRARDLKIPDATDFRSYNSQMESDPSTPEDFLWELLSASLQIFGKNKKKLIQSNLEKNKACYIFSRKLLSSEIKEPQYLTEVLLAWENIKLRPSSPSHFLLLASDSDSLHTPMSAGLKKINLEQSLLPPLDTPIWRDVVDDWLSGHFDVKSDDVLINALQVKKKEIEEKHPEQITMPLLHLRNHFKEIFLNHLSR